MAPYGSRMATREHHELKNSGSSLYSRLLGYAVVMEETIVEASSLPSYWSVQQAELYALTYTLQLSKGKKTNTDTDSKYAFAMLQGSV